MSTTPPRNGFGNGRRRLVLAVLFAIVATTAIAVSAWWLLLGRWHETTDDAYVGGNLVQITPQISGTVIAIHADDTDFVKAGEPLIELDKADTRVALEQAEAQLARSVRAVRNMFATEAELQANVAQREAELARAESDAARREKLVSTGAVSREELQHARDALEAARAALAAAREKLAAQRALVDNSTVANHPEVQAAAARVREAYLDWARTTLPAPVSGLVARRSVQVGQRVSPGAPLMAVVPLDQLWVEANFKENQLADLRIGQPATLTADAYGSAVVYHGRVAGLSAGTGSAFALLPPQNATGNWIKIVQRVPVRIALDPRELAEHPLRLGLSMQVDVDTHERSGRKLAEAAPRAPVYSTRVFASLERLADERVAAIIAANGGAPAAALRPARAGGPERPKRRGLPS